MAEIHAYFPETIADRDVSSIASRWKSELHGHKFTVEKDPNQGIISLMVLSGSLKEGAVDMLPRIVERTLQDSNFSLEIVSDAGSVTFRGAQRM